MSTPPTFAAVLWCVVDDESGVIRVAPCPKPSGYKGDKLPLIGEGCLKWHGLYKKGTVDADTLNEDIEALVAARVPFWCLLFQNVLDPMEAWRAYQARLAQLLRQRRDRLAEERRLWQEKKENGKRFRVETYATKSLERFEGSNVAVCQRGVPVDAWGRIFGQLPLKLRLHCVIATCRAWRSQIRAPAVFRRICFDSSFAPSPGSMERFGDTVGGTVEELSIHTLRDDISLHPPLAYHDIGKVSMWRQLPVAWCEHLPRLNPAKVHINGVFNDCGSGFLTELQNDQNLTELYLGYIKKLDRYDMGGIAALVDHCPRLERVVLYFRQLDPYLGDIPQTLRITESTLQNAGPCPCKIFVLSLASDTLPAALATPSWSGVRAVE